MIRLQARQAEAAIPAANLSGLIVEPVLLVTAPGSRPIALTQNPKLLEWIESATSLVAAVEADGTFQNGGWRVIRRGSTVYQGGRVTHDCLALNLGPKGK
jgi:hypothetical protein